MFATSNVICSRNHGYVQIVFICQYEFYCSPLVVERVQGVNNEHEPSASILVDIYIKELLSSCMKMPFIVLEINRKWILKQII